MADSQTKSSVFPSRLTKEPLIDAVFEIRFKAPDAVSSILPGIFHSVLEGHKTIEAMPTVQIPKEVRDNDDGLRYVPLVKIGWDKHWIFVGDSMLSIACKLPYPGWSTFKENIEKIVSIASAHYMINSVDRYALKYVNVFDSESMAPSQIFNLELAIGNKPATERQFQIKAEQLNDNILSVIQIVSEAEVTVIEQPTKVGAILDIDCSAKVDGESAQYFHEKLSDRLETIKSVNRSIFYECVSPKAIESLGPIYE